MPNRIRSAYFRKKTASGVRLASQFGHAGRNLHEHNGVAVEIAAQLCQVLGNVCHMGAEERRLWMPGDDPVAGVDKFLMTRKIPPVEAPLRMPVEFFPTLVLFIAGAEKGDWVGTVPQYRNLQLAGPLPDRIEPPVVRFD